MCSQCFSSAYCSSICQETDLRTHKILCKTVAQLPPRPTPQHKLGIHFPVEEKIPHLIWILCTPHQSGSNSSDSEGSVGSSSDTESREGDWERHLGSNSSDSEGYSSGTVESDESWDEPEIDHILEGRTEATMIGYNAFRKLSLGYMLEAWHRSTFEYDGSPLNESIHATTTSEYWKGPFVVVRRSFMKSFVDVNLEDFRTVVDFFSCKLRPHRSGQLVRGFTMNCKKSAEIRGEPTTPIIVPLDHKMFAEPPTSMSVMLGFPVIIYRQHLTLAGTKMPATTDDPSYQNEHVWALATSVESGQDWRSHFPRSKESYSGDYVVVRHDHKHLVRAHLEFLIIVAKPSSDVWREGVESGELNTQRATKRRHKGPDHFNNEFKKFRDIHAKTEASWTDVELPLDIDLPKTRAMDADQTSYDRKAAGIAILLGMDPELLRHKENLGLNLTMVDRLGKRHDRHANKLPPTSDILDTKIPVSSLLRLPPIRKIVD